MMAVGRMRMPKVEVSKADEMTSCSISKQNDELLFYWKNANIWPDLKIAFKHAMLDQIWQFDLNFDAKNLAIRVLISNV